MQTAKLKIFNSTITLRITALWAFSEAFLGGLLHGLKIPFAGLVLALIASICITIIASGTEKKGEIIKATLLVIALKFILSPHTPPMAYVAVFIQGFVGELLFLSKKFIKLSAFILTLFSLLYSAFQHLITLTIIFGKGFWSALDIFLNKITQSFLPGVHSYSLYIIIGYLSCYLLAGIFGGILNVGIVSRVNRNEKPEAIFLALNNLQNQDVFLNNKKRTKSRSILFIICGLLLLLLIFSYLPFFNNSFSKNHIAEIFLRGIIIVLVWNYFLTPLLKKWISRWVDKYKTKNAGALQQVIALLPDVKTILNTSWRLSKHPRKAIQVKNFITNSVLLILHHEK
jgi:hypothetical protein